MLYMVLLQELLLLLFNILKGFQSPVTLQRTDHHLTRYSAFHKYLPPAYFVKCGFKVYKT